MKKIIALLTVLSFTTTAGLPPASSKGSGESTYSTTFKTNYDKIPVTRSGPVVTIGTIPTTQGGTGSTNLGTGILRADSGVMSTASVSLITDVSNILPIANGGTGSATQNFVDLSTAQSIDGVKTFTSTISGSVTGNAGTVTNGVYTTDKLSALSATTSAELAGVVSDETGTGNLVYSDNPTFTNLNIGTASGNVTGNAATVTTNANLTGPITSMGNATSVASQTGTGSTFVMDTSPTLVTPNLGTPTALVGTNITGTASGLTAGTVTTNANLTGDVTSTGNATTYNNIVPTTKGGTGLSTVGTAGQVLTVSGAIVPAWETPSPRNSPLAMENISFTNTATANTLVISLKDSAGSDPSSPTSVIGFRSSTITSGLYTDVAVTAATSITLSSGSTLGHTSAVSGVIYLYAINNAGTVELAISGDRLNESYLRTTTAEGGAGGADSSTVLYSATARTNVPIRLIGRLLSTQTTAGTWATVATDASLNATFAGTPKVPGLDGNVDTFKVRYGATISTNCTTTPCPYIRQIGSAIDATNGITRSGTGALSIISTKTYSKLFCEIHPNCSGASIASSIPIYCENCAGGSFTTVRTDTNAACDSYGTVNCIGSY